MSHVAAMVRKGAFALAVVSLLGAGAVGAACSAFDSAAAEGDGGVDSSSASALDALAPEGGGADGALDALGPDAPPPVCTPAAVPGTAIAQTSHTFTSFTSSLSDGGAEGWASVGYDRDGLCTTATSTGVCMRFTGAPPSAQVDGNQGIDNAWGRGVAPLLSGSGLAFSTGFLKTDSAGDGSLVLIASSGKQFVIPVRGTRLDVQGTSATLSAIVPREALVPSIRLFAATFDLSLCSGATIDSMLAQLRQLSDILQNGTQTPTMQCDALSLGMILGGVMPGTVPAVDAGPNPCP
jgi:hypothetical protein